MTKQNLAKHIIIVALIEFYIHAVHADYSCLCNYNVELRVQSSNKSDASILGYMYEFDCKPVIQSVQLDSKWLTIAFEKQLGFVHGDGQTVIQTCAGSVPVEDKISTTNHKDMLSTTTVTSAPTSETSAVPTTSYTTLTDTISTKTVSSTNSRSDSTLTRTSLKLTTSPSSIVTATYVVTSPYSASTVSTRASVVTMVTPTQTSPTQHSSTSSSTELGTQATTRHVLLPSALLLGDPNKCNTGSDVTKITQYGKHCYEIVGLNDYQHRPWFSAELYCKLHGGHLLSILHDGEKEYIYNLLKYRNVTTPVWIGLSDKHGENFEWSSGEPLYWQPDWVPDDSLPASCVILDPVTYPGQWRNINCHTRHAFICQYNTTININAMSLIG